MKKRILSLILAVGMMTALAACGGSTGDSTGDSAGGDTSEAKGIPLKVATYYADTHPTSIALEEVFKPMIDEGTEGRYTVELYSNNGLGSETEFNEGVSLGTIECCVTGNLMADRYPALYAADFPWVFDSVEEASAVCNDPEIQQIFQDALIQSHYILRGCSINGNRCVSNNVRPINSLADLKGLKLRLPTVSHYVRNFELLGAAPVTMPMTEIFTALQQGTIEGQENPPSTLLANGWYEVQDYLAMTNHQIAMNFVLFNEDFYNSMSAEDQAVVDEASAAFVQKQLELFQQAMVDDVETLQEYGLEVTYPDREEMKAAGSGVIDEYRSEYPEFDDIMTKIEALQEEYRANAGAADAGTADAGAAETAETAEAAA